MWQCCCGQQARSASAADARAVAQLVHVTKQRHAELKGRDLSTTLLGLMKLGLLQQHTSWFYNCVLPQVVKQLQELQPVGVSIVLRALLELETAAVQMQGPVPVAAAAAAAAGSMPWQGTSSSSTQPGTHEASAV